MRLRKIPLGPLLEILQDLYDNGADFIDISGENNAEGEEKKDIVKITVKPDYLMDREAEEEEDDDDEDYEMTENEEIHMDYTDALKEDVEIYSPKEENNKKSLSDEDINDLI